MVTADASGRAEPRKDFFISYNRADRAWAEWIAWQLEEAGYTTVLQAWDFRPGGNFVLDMQRAAAQADRTLAVLSPDFLASAFTQPEWAAAFVQDPTGEKGILVPVRVRACDPQGLLRAITYIDLVDAVEAGDEAVAREVLLAEVQRGRRKPQMAPGFPRGTGTPPSVPERPRFPGALPPIWNVPHRRNPNFTGREDLLGQLRTALTSGQPAALAQTLVGLGGVGKTQLATEYAYRYASDYGVVWWVRAEDPTTLAADYALLARELDLLEQAEQDQSIVVASVRRWLQQNQGWLIIFDNAREPAEVRPYLPQGGGGHVLITTRDHAWRAVVRAVTVKVFSPDEAVIFLLNRTGQTDESAARALAADLGELPLALEQAGAYMDVKGRSLTEYLQLFQTHQQEVLRRGPSPEDYPATVATTWELAFQQVAEASPAGADLLHLCAFLAPDTIPRGLLSGGAEYLPQPLASTVTDPFTFDDAVEAVLRYSLVEVRDGGLSMHRLVQAVARDRLEREARRAWSEASARLVNGAFPHVEVQTWSTCAQLLPHALAVAGHAEPLHVADEVLGRLLNQVGFYLKERAQFADARRAFERALAMHARVLGPDHPDTALSLNNLGYVLQAQGDLAGARPYLERALDIVEKTMGPNHPDTAQCLNNFGWLLRDQGELTGAYRYLERALDIRERVLGPNHPTTAESLINFGWLLRDQGDLAGARPYFERALIIYQRVLGPDDLATALALNNLGWLLRDQGDLAGARPYLEHALAIRERELGPDHPTTGTSLNNFGLLLWDQGDLIDARLNLERALAIRERMLGPSHPDTGNSLNNLAALLEAQGELGAAQSYYERARKVWQERGDRHREAIGFFHLGRVAVKLGREDEGTRLVVLCFLINQEIEHADTEMNWRTLTDLAKHLDYSQEQLDWLLREVAAAYQADHGRGLVQAAFVGTAAETPP